MPEPSSSGSKAKHNANLKDEFAVVLKLRRKDGTSVDLLIHENDDPKELATKYAYEVGGMPNRAVSKLAQLIEAKRAEALSDYDLEISHVEVTSVASSPNVLSAPATPFAVSQTNLTGGDPSSASRSTGKGKSKGSMLVVDALGNLAIGSPTEGSNEKRRLFEEARYASSPPAFGGTGMSDSGTFFPSGSPTDRSVSFADGSPESRKTAEQSIRSHSHEGGSPHANHLFEDQTRQVERRRQLSLRVDAEKLSALNASSYIRTRSPSSAGSPGSAGSSPRSSQELDAAAAATYKRGIHARNLREASLEKIRAERSKAQYELEGKELTFQPKLAISSKHQAKLTVRRSGIMSSPRSNAGSPSSSLPATPSGEAPVWLKDAFPHASKNCSSDSPVTAEGALATRSSESSPMTFDVHTSRSSADLLDACVQRSRAASAERATRTTSGAFSGSSRSLSPPWHRITGPSPVAASANQQEEGGIVEWLYYQSRKDHEKSRQELEAKVQKEREKLMPFRPVLTEHSVVLAQKKREHKLQRYALLERSRKSSTPTSARAEERPGRSRGRMSVIESSVSSMFRPNRTKRFSFGDDRSRSSSVDQACDESKSPQPEANPEGKFNEQMYTGSAYDDGSESAPVSTVNPFDVHAAELEESAKAAHALPTYSPDSYIRAVQCASHTGLSEQSCVLSPKSRTDALFQSLYNGRLDVEQAHKLAADKHDPKYTFSPRLTAGASAKQVEPTQQLFCERLANTPLRAKSAETSTPSPKRMVIDAATEEMMLKRMTKLWPRRDAAAREKRQRELESTIRSRSNICHDNAPAFTEDFSRQARERSLSEIFDVLLLSAVFIFEARLKEQLETSVISAAQMRAALDEHAQRENCAKEALLNTEHAQTCFVEPKDLRDALEMVIAGARPVPLNRAEFIHRCEALIKSGAAPPINAILTAPHRPARYKHTDDMIAEKHVRPPVLEAKRTSERMNKQRGVQGAYRRGYDPTKYSREQSVKRELLVRDAAVEETKKCTFAPEIRTAHSWKNVQNDHRGYKDVVIARPSRSTKPIPSARRRVVSPAVATILSRSSCNDIAAQVQKERSPSPRLRALATSVGSAKLAGSSSTSPILARNVSSAASESKRASAAVRSQPTAHTPLSQAHAAHSEAPGTPRTDDLLHQVGKQTEVVQSFTLPSTERLVSTDRDNATNTPVVHSEPAKSPTKGGTAEVRSLDVHFEPTLVPSTPATSSQALNTLRVGQPAAQPASTDDAPIAPFLLDDRADSAARLDKAARDMLRAETATRSSHNHVTAEGIVEAATWREVGDGRRTEGELNAARASADQLLESHDAQLKLQSASIAAMLGHNSIKSSPHLSPAKKEQQQQQQQPIYMSTNWAPSPSSEDVVERMTEGFPQPDSSSPKIKLNVESTETTESRAELTPLLQQECSAPVISATQPEVSPGPDAPAILQRVETLPDTPPVSETLPSNETLPGALLELQQRVETTSEIRLEVSPCPETHASAGLQTTEGEQNQLKQEPDECEKTQNAPFDNVPDADVLNQGQRPQSDLNKNVEFSEKRVSESAPTVQPAIDEAATAGESELPLVMEGLLGEKKSAPSPELHPLQLVFDNIDDETPHTQYMGVPLNPFDFASESLVDSAAIAGTPETVAMQVLSQPELAPPASSVESLDLDIALALAEADSDSSREASIKDKPARNNSGRAKYLEARSRRGRK